MIRPGMVADLIVVDGAPLADLELVCDPGSLWLVHQGGRAVAGIERMAWTSSLVARR
jgi:imidazolonepropionase-like amidohydrolase